MQTLIFNKDKTIEQYEKPALFLGPNPGLADTIHMHYPKIEALDSEMRSLDWKWNEFDFAQCRTDFKQVPKDVADMMIENLAYQWEADSVASRWPVVIIAPFNPCSEIANAELRINDNETVHAKTYSEIVRLSFDNPDEVLKTILNYQAAQKRLDLIVAELNGILKYSIEYAYKKSIGVLTDEDEEKAKECIIMFYYCMLCLERIQFMASFSITFTIVKSGPFQPIGTAVKKIAQDELEVHCEFRKEVLRECRLVWPEVFDRLVPRMTSILESVVDGELEWTATQFHKRSLIGTNEKLVSQWVLFSAKDVAKFIGMQTKYTFPKQNPMPHLEDYLDMNKTQAAPQEQDLAQYKVNVVEQDDANVDFDF